MGTPTKETETVWLRLTTNPAKLERWEETAERWAMDVEDGHVTPDRAYRMLGENIRSAVTSECDAHQGLPLDLMTDALRRVDWPEIAQRFIYDAVDRLEEVA